MINLTGIAASEGIAIAKIFKLKEPNLVVKSEHITDIDTEIVNFETAIKKAISDLEVIKAKTMLNMGLNEARILEAHIKILQDPELIGKTIEKIKTESVNAAFCFHVVAEQFVVMFEQMADAYFRERAADIKDIKKRVLAHLLDVTLNDPSTISEEVVIVAHDLTPSHTAQLNRKFVKGFATNIGGRTSHSAIMARSLEIPAIVGIDSILERANDGDKVILDGLAGEIILKPTAVQIAAYEAKIKKLKVEKEALKKLESDSTMTKDGHQVTLAANIGTPIDAKRSTAYKAEGIGLYRTEFLYMDRIDFPTEDEQFTAYKTVLEEMKDKPVIVRTLDIGGDKALPYMQLPQEMNPFLGYRAIRICLDQQDLFKTQLRALLRASIYGKLYVMFPMIATLDEFRAAKKFLLETKAELLAQGIDVSENIQIGIMVEMPATAILADQFAKEVDFFSIGTNDLIQYTMAADRMNEKIAYLYQPLNPSILRLIKMVIDASHQAGKWTGMCGEMAGDAMAIPLLLGMGLNEFSMSAASIPSARKQISTLTKVEMQDLAEKALNMRTADEVMALVKKAASQI